MDQSSTAMPIVVGIDGSKHAVRAAIWAVDEAVDRDIPMELVYVVDGHSSDLDREYAEAHHALHKAWVAAADTGKPVKLESSVLEGDPVTQLVEASRAAEMICVGQRGTNDSPPHQRGSTAAELAVRAFSPVAIIRRRHTREPMPAGRWIAAALSETPDSHAVLQTAFDEAVLREAPVMALVHGWKENASGTNGDAKLHARLDRYLDGTKDDAADVQVCLLAFPDDMLNFLAQSKSVDQLVIFGSDDADLIAEVVSPEARAMLRHTNCSLLILRDRQA